MAHLYYHKDFTISAYIVYEQRVLLGLHKKKGMWLPLGGHVEPNEDPEEALFREIHEECGLAAGDIEVYGTKAPIGSETVIPLFPPYDMNIHHFSGEHWHIGMIYFARALHHNVRLNADEHTDLRWFSAKKLFTDPSPLSAPLPPDVAYYCKNALEVIA